jgi:hypothetical protein
MPKMKKKPFPLFAKKGGDGAIPVAPKPKGKKKVGKGNSDMAMLKRMKMPA